MSCNWRGDFTRNRINLHLIPGQVARRCNVIRVFRVSHEGKARLRIFTQVRAINLAFHCGSDITGHRRIGRLVGARISVNDGKVRRHARLGTVRVGDFYRNGNGGAVRYVFAWGCSNGTAFIDGEFPILGPLILRRQRVLGLFRIIQQCRDIRLHWLASLSQLGTVEGVILAGAFTNNANGAGSDLRVRATGVVSLHRNGELRAWQGRLRDGGGQFTSVLIDGDNPVTHLVLGAAILKGVAVRLFVRFLAAQPHWWHDRLKLHFLLGLAAHRSVIRNLHVIDYLEGNIDFIDSAIRVSSPDLRGNRREVVGVLRRLCGDLAVLIYGHRPALRNGSWDYLIRLRVKGAIVINNLAHG